MRGDPRQRDLKRALRRSVAASVMNLSPRERSTQESVLQGLFPRLPGYGSAQAVLLYVTAFPEEMDTRPFLHDALASGKRVLCPRVDRAARRLRLFEIRSLSNDLQPGAFGIPEPWPGCPEVEPAQVDWALIPGLAFDERCYRLGRGAGYYDRLIPALRRDCPRWALGFDCQVLDSLPLEPHDIPIDGVATPGASFTRA